MLRHSIPFNLSIASKLEIIKGKTTTTTTTTIDDKNKNTLLNECQQQQLQHIDPVSASQYISNTIFSKQYFHDYKELYIQC